MIRSATVKDVPQIARLIAQFAERGKMLFRSHAELYETVRDFVVFEHAAPAGALEIAGVCALEIVWADLAEVKSLAVDAAHQGKGVGKQLVNATVDEARRLQIQRVFALTYEQFFFEKLGFVVVDKSALPLKVWSACVKCPKRDGCDEIAVVKTLFDAPALEAANPDEQAGLRYEVPASKIHLGKRLQPPA
jgi:amino-acid N-acetyltransferase